MKVRVGVDCEAGCVVGGVFGEVDDGDVIAVVVTGVLCADVEVVLPAVCVGVEAVSVDVEVALSVCCPWCNS